MKILEYIVECFVPNIIKNWNVGQYSSRRILTGLVVMELIKCY